MNLLLLTEADRIAPACNRFALTDRRHAHLRDVLGAAPGKAFRVGLWDGDKGRATVVTANAERTELSVEWTEPAPPRPAVHLILAIPRPKSLKKLLPEIVAMGVGRLTLLRSWRVAQPYLSSPLLKPDAQTPLVMDGLMQAGCTRPPIIEVAERFNPFVQDVAAHLGAPVKWILHPRAAQPVSAERPGSDPVALAVGPEGGWTDYELETFDEAGFSAVALSDRVLRVETACVALLAQLAVVRAWSVSS